jgi:hypothetical protein
VASGSGRGICPAEEEASKASIEGDSACRRWKTLTSQEDLVVSTADSAGHDGISTETAWEDVTSAFPIAKPGARFLRPQQKDVDCRYGGTSKSQSQQEDYAELEAELEPARGETGESIPLQAPKEPEPEPSSPSVGGLSSQPRTSSHESGGGR